MLFSTDKGNDHQEDDLYDTPMIIPCKSTHSLLARLSLRSSYIISPCHKLPKSSFLADYFFSWRVVKFAKCKVGLSENLVDIVPNKHSGNVKKWDLMSQQLSREVIDIANAESPGIPAIPLNQGFFPSADGAKNDANLLVRQYANGEVDLGQDRNLGESMSYLISSAHCCISLLEVF